MKRTLPLLLSVVLCLTVFTACAGVPDNSEPDPETLIRQGDAALAEGDTEQARIMYKEAGEAGEEKLTDVLVQISKNYTVGDPGPNSIKIAMNHLCNIPESGRTRQDVAERMLEVADQYLTLMEEESISDPEEAFLPVKDLLDAVMCTDLPEYSQMAERLGWMWGWEYLNSRDPEKAILVWESFPDHPTMNALAGAANLIRQKEYMAAVKLLREKVENYSVYEAELMNELAEDADNTLQQSIDLTAARATVFFEDPPVLDEAAAWIESSTAFNLSGTIEKIGDAPDLTSEDLKTLETLCGQEPEGKILILSRRRPYGSAELITELYPGTSVILPPAYIPERLEQVQYVILIDNDYEDTGETFEVGTKLLKETVVVQVYKVGNPDPVYTSPRRETCILPSTFLIYSGDPPVYYAPSHPNIGSDMKKALKIIMEDIY